jgi:hypothetical protein
MEFAVTEDVVIGLWEQYSGRPMTPDESARARGHKLVRHLMTFTEPVLMSAAFSARRRGQDLDWASWRDWAVRKQKSQGLAGSRRQPSPTSGSAKTDRIFNSNSRTPSRYTTDSGKATARAPGYSGGTLPHAGGKPSKHY